MRARYLLAAVFVIGLAACPVRAEEQAKPAGDAAAEQEMMKKWQEAATPGEAHKRLESLVGNWSHTVRWSMTPDEKPTESKGTNTNTMILGGRFLKQETQGEAMGQPFEGLGISGYDNVRKEYNSVWIDSMGTGMMTGTGQFDAAQNAITEKGEFSCPITGNQHMIYRSVWKIIDPNHYTYEMYTAAPDGKEFRSMDIAYERVQ